MCNIEDPNSEAEDCDRVSDSSHSGPETISDPSAEDSHWTWMEADRGYQLENELFADEEILDELKEIMMGHEEELHAIRMCSCRVQAFNLLVTSKIPRQAFEQLRFAFGDKLQIASEYTIFHCMHVLSGVNPITYDCCPNSCVTYTKKFIHFQACLYCNEPRFKNGKARQSFVYFPMIPHLQGYFRSTEMIEKMSYRSCYQSQPGKIADVFDGAHYH